MLICSSATINAWTWKRKGYKILTTHRNPYNPPVVFQCLCNTERERSIISSLQACKGRISFLSASKFTHDRKADMEVWLIKVQPTVTVCPTCCTFEEVLCCGPVWVTQTRAGPQGLKSPDSDGACKIKTQIKTSLRAQKRWQTPDVWGKVRHTNRRNPKLKWHCRLTSFIRSYEVHLLMLARSLCYIQANSHIWINSHCCGSEPRSTSLPPSTLQPQFKIDESAASPPSASTQRQISASGLHHYAFVCNCAPV